MKDYASYSFWLETADDDLTPRPPLDGSIDVDVAILGAGYSGLWTAYYLLQRDPSLSVAVVEREIAGFGASGRNGGWCTSGFGVTPTTLEERYGTDTARDVLLAMYDAVDEVGRICAAEDIDAHYIKSGVLRLARGQHQVPLIEDAYRTYERFGLTDHYELLDAGRTAERVLVDGVPGSLWIREGATIHPGRLARGLARAVERKGGKIYEQTSVVDFESGPSPLLRTNRGDVRARTIVLAGEAYLTELDSLNRQLLPIYSSISLTEPLSNAQWAEIGWQGRECIASSRYMVDYLQRTLDGRILFGSRGSPYRFGGEIVDANDYHEPTHALIRQMLVDWFPTLKDIRFTHEWGGPIGVPRDWMPVMTYDPASGIATTRGYSGQGVSTANLGGRIVADLITGTQSSLTELPMARHRSPEWEAEPLRWLAVRYIFKAFARLDEDAARTGRAPSGRSLAERLARH